MNISNQYWTSMNIEQKGRTEYKLSMAVQKKWFSLNNYRTQCSTEPTDALSAGRFRKKIRHQFFQNIWPILNFELVNLKT